MNQEYKRIKSALYKQSPRFKRKQTKVFLLFFLKVVLCELPIAALAVGAYVLSPASALAFLIIGIVIFVILLKKAFLEKKALYGTVVKISRDNLIVKSDYINRMTQKNFSIYTIDTPDGKKKELILPIPYERVFKKGDMIIRLPGMDYPVDLTPEELLICPFCGNIFPTENKDCIECGEPALNAKVIDGIK